MKMTYSFNISSKTFSMRTTKDLQSRLQHNLRGWSEKYNENNKNNIVIVKGSSKVVDAIDDYKKLLVEEMGLALAKYNNNQKRNDRKITDLIKYVNNSKSDVATELIIGLGNIDIWNEFGKDKKREWTIDYFKNQCLKDLERVLPNFKVFSAVVHYDEIGHPHMQVLGVPLSYGNKKSLEVQISKSQTFTKDNIADMQEAMRESCFSYINNNFKEKGIMQNGKVLEFEKTEKAEEKRKNLSKEMYILHKEKINKLEKSEKELEDEEREINERIRRKKEIVEKIRGEENNLNTEREEIEERKKRLKEKIIEIKKEFVDVIKNFIDFHKEFSNKMKTEVMELNREKLDIGKYLELTKFLYDMSIRKMNYEYLGYFVKDKEEIKEIFEEGIEKVEETKKMIEEYELNLEIFDIVKEKSKEIIQEEIKNREVEEIRREVERLNRGIKF